MLASLLAATEAVSPPFPHLLTSLIVVPAVGALLVALISKSRPDACRQVGFLASALTAALSIFVMIEFQTGEGDFQFVETATWIKEFGIGWKLGVDGISLFLVVLTGVLFPLAILAVIPEHDPKPYYAWLLVLQSSSMGVFLALDLFVFFVFFEIVLVPMYFLIGKWGHGNRTYAALKFFIYTMFGSAVMLVGIISLVALTQRATGGDVTFDLRVLADAQVLSTNTARAVFCAFALAFSIKVPIFPLHTWLPDAHTEAPTAGSVILAGVMLKLGTYGFLRFGLYLFPEASRWAAPLFLVLGVIGITYGALVATMQKDLKRLVAYSSVAHLGFIVLGTFAMNRQGITGGILQMVNHGLSTGALFLLVGRIYERRHTRLIAELNGLQKSAPLMAAAFTVVMLSSVGLPGLNGFVGEFLILNGTFIAHRWYAVVAATGVILAALYLLWAYQRTFHGTPKNEENERFADLNFREGAMLLVFIAGIVFMGIFPKPVIDRIEPSVDRLIAQIEDKTDTFTAPEATPALAAGDGEADAHAEDAPAGEDEGGTEGEGGTGNGATEEDATEEDATEEDIVVGEAAAEAEQLAVTEPAARAGAAQLTEALEAAEASAAEEHK
ncbi:MAG: NADH-quinone oxidoreductase subunit M [Acidimicrobiales bacterium]|nr:NADH-quinone oxidoreductase subunit M [Acidimicrobiales bacterium]